MKDLAKDAGPDREIREVAPMPGYEHTFKDDVCTGCKKTSLQAKFTICDARARKNT